LRKVEGRGGNKLFQKTEPRCCKDVADVKKRFCWGGRLYCTGRGIGGGKERKKKKN